MLRRLVRPHSRLFLANQVRALSEAAPTEETTQLEQVKKQFRDSDKRWKAKMERLQRRRKTEMCSTFEKTGSCSNPNCMFAHGFADIKSLDCLIDAEQVAKTRGAVPTIDDILDAKANSILKRGTGLLPLVQNSDILTEATTRVEYSYEKLEDVDLVEKAALTIRVTSFVNKWHLTAEQTSALLKVVGPRYDVKENEFRLVRRFRAPFTEVLDEDTVYDPLIQKLVLLVKEVKAAFPPIYSFTEDVVPYPSKPLAISLSIGEADSEEVKVYV